MADLSGAVDDHAVPPWLARTVALAWRLSFLGLLAVVAVSAVWRVRLVVLPLFVAVVLTSLLSPLVRWLERHNVPSLAGTLLVFAGAIVTITSVGVAIGPGIGAQLGNLGDTLTDGREQLREWLTRGPLHLSEGQVNASLDGAADALRSNRGRVAGGVLSGATIAVELVSGLLMTLVLAFFFVKDGPAMVDWVGNQFDGPLRRDISAIASRSYKTLSGYILGSTADGIVEAALKAVGLLVLGVPLVVPLALLTFLGGYVPLVGALLAGSVSATVALVTRGPGTALAVVVLSVVIQNVEGHLLQPLIMGKAVKLHPVVILLSISTFGILGGLASAPSLRCPPWPLRPA